MRLIAKIPLQSINVTHEPEPAAPLYGTNKQKHCSAMAQMKNCIMQMDVVHSFESVKAMSMDQNWAIKWKK